MPSDLRAESRGAGVAEGEALAEEARAEEVVSRRSSALLVAFSPLHPLAPSAAALDSLATSPWVLLLQTCSLALGYKVYGFTTERSKPPQSVDLRP